MRPTTLTAAALAAALSLPGAPLRAQNQAGKADDQARIALTAVVPDQLTHIPAESRKMLQTKLNMVAAKNGMGGTARSPRFVITANVDVLSKDVVPGAPPKVSQTLGVTLFVADAVAEQVFASTSVEVKGVGANETKAYNAALGRIAPGNPQIRQMIEQGKEKIVEFYNSQCDFILKEARSLAAAREHDKALATLAGVPAVCKECHAKAYDLMPEIYAEQRARECQESVAKARSAYAGKDFEAALRHLSQVLPGDECYGEAEELYRRVEQEQCEQSMADARAAWAVHDFMAAAAALRHITPQCDCHADAERLTREIQASIPEDQKGDFAARAQQQARDYALQVAAVEADIEKSRAEAAQAAATRAAADIDAFRNLMWIFGR